ncbi:sigma-54-dependent Fis family transcriptional regulator [Variovorax ginsengisoli]|uniref:Transcriptional regulator of acetoin/glycerol metabolism n=1 Tax=Variovorax ginsengisoli TaxID=363844 RepID=A0ABT9S3R2_9BURK|nr:sigma-54-dependent Fis family transcriptional regulator [Variovorax ginsengisoli]MDP9897992.1 transcriptional regulator of acetoin/glycerol metabolism [Variovorax ginsengisoli]
MTETHPSAGQVALARERFFEQGLDPAPWIAPHISRSWRRSQPVAHAAPAPMGRVMLDERREQAMRLLACAQAELEGLAEHATGHGCVVVLTDAHGLILEEIGSPDFLPKAERFALLPGVDWSEPACGTNAIGTALAEREALTVLGREHYLAQNSALGCAAAPIFTSRGGIAGVLDISGEPQQINQHALGLVRMAAQQVEHRLMRSQTQGQVLRFHRRPALLGSAREGLMHVLEGQIVGANRVALELFGMSWEQLLDQDVESLLGRRWTRVEQQRGLLTLPDGDQIAAIMEGAARAEARPHRVAQAALPGIGCAAPSPHTDAVLPLLSQAVRVLNQGVSVLIAGETGSGKEVFARRLHQGGRRSGGPFVAVDCASLPETLIEAELFGYAEGAFTGARRRGMPGRIREADGGLLFLDEIAEMPLSLQSRLLRVLEERVVTPLGGGPSAAVDFDLVCATHADLPAMVAAGRFRADLMYRVAGFGASLPALRERTDRRELITRLFAELGGSGKRLQLQPDALDALTAYRWPGNVRELRSVLQTLVALADPDDLVGLTHLPLAVQGGPTAIGSNADLPGTAPMPLATMTRQRIDQILQDCGFDVAAAASRLGVHRSTVYRHLARQRK